METLKEWAPGAGAPAGRDAVQLLLECPEADVERRASEVATLMPEDLAKYKAAVELGTRSLLLHVENVVSGLVQNPGAVPNLRVNPKKKDKGTFAGTYVGPGPPSFFSPFSPLFRGLARAGRPMKNIGISREAMWAF